MNKASTLLTKLGSRTTLVTKWRVRVKRTSICLCPPCGCVF